PVASVCVDGRLKAPVQARGAKGQDRQFRTNHGSGFGRDITAGFRPAHRPGSLLDAFAYRGITPLGDLPGQFWRRWGAPKRSHKLKEAHAIPSFTRCVAK